ncbi:MAG: hypothetical protein HUJ89_03625 [Bacteroidales bacterium]|nr:hypothetical protein [Bacteroidales bacterium]
MNRIKHIFTLVCLAVLTISCSAERELQYSNQEAAIDKYISGTLANYEVRRNAGSNRVIIEPSTAADSLEAGDSLSFFYACYVFSGSPSSLATTNVPEIARKSNFVLTDFDSTVVSIKYENSNLCAGLYNGLKGVREREHCVILFSAKYGFAATRVNNIPPMSALCYEIWVEEVKKKK